MKKLILATAMLAIAVPAAAQQTEDPAFTAKVRATLLAHPEILAEAMAAGQQKQQAQQQADLNSKVGPVRKQLMADDFGPALGNPKGTVRVVEFVDYACPICKVANRDVESIVSKRPELRVTIAMRQIFGQDSEKLARFALASDLQGKFPATHDALYAAFGNHHETKPTDEALKAVADKVGLDYDRVMRDMNGAKVNATLANQTKLADQIGVSGTPFFITSDAVYPGAANEQIMNQAFR